MLLVKNPFHVRGATTTPEPRFQATGFRVKLGEDMLLLWSCEWDLLGCSRNVLEEGFATLERSSPPRPRAMLFELHDLSRILHYKLGFLSRQALGSN